MPSRPQFDEYGIDANVWNFYTCPDERVPHRTPAIDLLTPSRLDIVARYLFVKHRELGWGTGYATSVYRALLETWNAEFVDGDGTKNSFTDYLRTFCSLADSVATTGWDRKRGVLPYVDDTLVDGAHRLAVAIHHNLEVDALELEGQRQIQSAKRLLAAGLSKQFVDALVQEYIRLAMGAYAAIFFPAPFAAQENAVAALDEAGQVIHDIELFLSEQGKRNLIELLYGHEPWWKIDLLEEFVALRFPKGSQVVRIVFVATASGKPSRPLKEVARAHLPQTHCLHMNDTHQETNWIADIVLNENGRQFLNLRPTQFPRRLSYLLKIYKGTLEKTPNPQKYCIDSGAVLAAFGLRDCTDIDYITPEVRTHKLLVGGEEQISWHNDEYGNFPITLDEIVANPSHHFSYKGVKFMSLNTVLLFKKFRGAEKDIADLRLIVDAKAHRPRKDWRRETLKSLKSIRYQAAVHSAYLGTKLLRTLLPPAIYVRIRDLYRARKGP